MVVTVFDEEGFRLARRLLRQFGTIERTEYFNVLVMEVPEIEAFTQAIAALFEDTPGYLNAISRIVPAHAVFDYHSPEEFLAKGEDVVLGWSDMLTDKSFYIRLHRRGFRGRIVSPEAERSLDDALLRRLEERGRPGHIDFEDPDLVIDIETVDDRAGVSIWTKEQLSRFSFLHID